MSLVIQNDFGEYYNSLLSRPRGVEDLLKDVRREEVAARKRIGEEEISAFGDMLHIAAVWISRKKAREHGEGAHTDRASLALIEKECEIWFPESAPRAVTPPARMKGRGFPMAAYREMSAEEAELRNWLNGVESKLREQMERASQEALFIITCTDQLFAREARLRSRLERDESDAVAAIRKRVFLAAPPDFFRRLAVERFGATPETADAAPEGATPDEAEAYRRGRVEDSERAGRAAIHKPLVEAYDAQLFMVHHQEICDRMALEEEQREKLSLRVLEAARDSFGLLSYHTAALAFHVTPGMAPVLRELASLQVIDSAARGQAFRESYAESRAAAAGAPAWELLFPEVAAQGYSVADVKRDSSSSSTPQRTPSAPQLPLPESPVTPPAAPVAAIQTAVQPSDSASAHAHTDEPPVSSWKKSSGEGKSAAARNVVHFNDSLDVVQADAVGTANPPVRSAAERGAGAEAAAAGRPVTVAAPKPKKRKERRGSFRAFESQSDEESADDEAFTY